jgi:hypothetical protein
MKLPPVTRLCYIREAALTFRQVETAKSQGRGCIGAEFAPKSGEAMTQIHPSVVDGLAGPLIGEPVYRKRSH